MITKLEWVEEMLQQIDAWAESPEGRAYIEHSRHLAQIDATQQADSVRSRSLHTGERGAGA